MAVSETIRRHPQIILRRRHYGGMVIKHLDPVNTPKIKISKKPIEDEQERREYLQQRFNREYDITQGQPINQTQAESVIDKSAPQRNRYNKVITSDMKDSDIVQIETDRSNLSVIYTDKAGNITIKQGGNKAWRTNNPGNLSFSSLEKAREAGAIGVWEDSQGHKFGVFPSEEAGTQALKNKLKERRFSYRKDNSKRTVADMIEEIYAPSSDNNDSRGYARFLRDRYGVDVYNKAVEDLDDEGLERLIQGIAAREGNKQGQLITKK